MAGPTVSVILPAYNAARHVSAALKSILGQSFGDFEIVVIDDGSSDGTVTQVEKFSDSRIRLVRNETNRGIVFSLNRGIEESRGRYIARMDADDIARPERLARQVAFMEANPEVGVCGTWARKFIPYGPRWIQKGPVESASLKAMLLFATPFVHPTVMMRRSVLEKYGLRYDPAFPGVEDYRLWCEMALVTELAVVPEVLLDYRVSLSGITGTVFLDQERLERRRRILMKLWGEYIERTLGLAPTAEQLETHAIFHDAKVASISREDKEKAREWLAMIRQKNEERSFFDSGILAQVCGVAEQALFYPSLYDRFRHLTVFLLGK